MVDARFGPFFARPFSSERFRRGHARRHRRERQAADALRGDRAGVPLSAAAACPAREHRSGPRAPADRVLDLPAHRRRLDYDVGGFSLGAGGTRSKSGRSAGIQLHTRPRSRARRPQHRDDLRAGRAQGPMAAPRLRPPAGPVRAGATGERHRRAPDRSRLPDGGQRGRGRLLQRPQEPGLAADRPGCPPPRRGGARGRSQARARGRRRARDRPAVRGPAGREPVSSSTPPRRRSSWPWRS